MDFGQRIPWQFKVIGKVVLSRLPLRYGVWSALGVFKHGDMEDPAYAYRVFRTHFDRASFGKRNDPFVALEIGPGDSVSSALLARAHGAEGMYLVDAGPFATADFKVYLAMIDFLASRGTPVPGLQAVESVDALLAACGARYLTAGLESLRSIPDCSVDFVLSHAVLEHIRRAEFFDTLMELRRVLRPDGVCSHRVDLKDHLGGALNNLRFSTRFWESKAMASSGFYTNRIRCTEMLQLFDRAHFDAQVLKVDRWDRVPTPRAKLSREFRDLPERELRVSGFDVILKPR